jgi:hypothetical protein
MDEAEWQEYDPSGPNNYTEGQNKEWVLQAFANLHEWIATLQEHVIECDGGYAVAAMQLPSMAQALLTLEGVLVSRCLEPDEVAEVGLHILQTVTGAPHTIVAMIEDSDGGHGVLFHREDVVVPDSLEGLNE